MTVKLGFIGGSGIYNIEGINTIKEIEVETPFGIPSSKVLHGEVDGYEFYFLPRHGSGHTILPSEINYRANIFAMKSLGVDTLVSLSAVGSLKEEISPRMIFLPDQFIDWTKGKRERTFFGEGMVGHVSTAYPIEKSLQQRIKQACEKLEINHAADGAYICIEGPQFSSRAESEFYRSIGAKVIGMTNVPESYLAKEAGMAYATIALVTDYDCWKEEHCTVDEIMKVMSDNYNTAKKLMPELVRELSVNPIVFTPENKFAVVTGENDLNQNHKKVLEVLLRSQ